MPPTYLSLFTGAGGLDLGLDNAGWTGIGQCEIDETCRAVLARHWPDVPRWTDVRDVRRGEPTGRDQNRARDPSAGHGRGETGPRLPSRAPDLIVGGFPCQDVSVAGRRAGLAGKRSGLWWEFHRIIEAVRPRAVLVENVEGLISSNGGRDMGAILDALVDLGYCVAWRVLDAQHFGVPQRRRRVFLLALLGGRAGAERAAKVLALTEGSGGDPPTRRSPRPGTTGGAGGSIADTLRSHPRPGSNSNGALVVGALTRGGPAKRDDQAIGAGQLIALDRQAGGPDDNSAQANHLTATTNGVRRLTPRECERLMGWPDDHTRWTHDGREVADSRRYAMCGNGVVAPVAQWIAERLAHELTTGDA